VGSTVASLAVWITTDSPAALGALLALNLLAFGLLVLAHELGHAAVGLVRTEGLVVLSVGRSATVWQCRIGRLKLELNALPLMGRAQVHARLDRKSTLLFLLAGPTAGSAAAALLILLGHRFRFQPLEIIGWVGLAVNVANLLPSRRSDGAQLVAALRSRRPAPPTEPLVDVRARWLVLVTDARGSLARHTGGLLMRVLNALDRKPSDRSAEAVALVRMAFSGWCWREAERCDLAPIRDLILDARHRAAQMGLSRGDIEGWAALKLARHPDLTAASPRPDSLEYGLRCARGGNFTDGVPEEHAEFAFRFGVAVHDLIEVA
jgi:hypothetical protein